MLITNVALNCTSSTIWGIKIQIQYWLEITITHVFRESFLKFCIYTRFVDTSVSNPFPVLNFFRQNFFHNFCHDWLIYLQISQFSINSFSFRIRVRWRLSIPNQILFISWSNFLNFEDFYFNIISCHNCWIDFPKWVQFLVILTEFLHSNG